MSTQIRLPSDLHDQLKRIADREERSLNSLMVYLLRQAAERYGFESSHRETASVDEPGAPA